MPAFYARKQGSIGVVESRFISQDSAIVSGNFDGAIFVWNLYDP
uniref:Uncharacterized protein n=1 Tax=Tetranychus urticae TaxID=32264 RepID=T1KSR0_TETUR